MVASSILYLPSEDQCLGLSHLKVTPVPVAGQNKSQRCVCIQKAGARAEHQLTPQCASLGFTLRVPPCSSAYVGYTLHHPCSTACLACFVNSLLQGQGLIPVLTLVLPRLSRQLKWLQSLYIRSSVCMSRLPSGTCLGFTRTTPVSRGTVFLL